MKIRRRPRTSPSNRRLLQRARRYAAWGSGALLASLVLLYIAARIYWPTVATSQLDLEALLTRTTHHTVRLGRVEPYWDGLNPGVRVWGATVYGEDGRTPSVRIAEVQGTVALLPLLWGRVEVGRLVLSRPVLTLVRDEDGRIAVAGLASRPQQSPGGAAAWLLQQPRVIVQDGEMRWVDAREAGTALLLSRLEIDLRNSGERHRVAVSANLPRALCRECSLALDISGNPLAGPWDGEVSLRAQGLNITALPLALRERLPETLQGQFDLQLWSDWSGGRPQWVRGDAAVKALRAPLGGERPPLALRELAANVIWRADGSGWRLDLTDLKLALSRRRWSAGRLRITKGDAESSLEVQHVELDDVTAFAANYQSLHPMLKRWVDMRPAGALERVDVRLRGPFDKPEAFTAKARLLDVGVAAYERVPGVRGLSGNVSFDANRGDLEIDAADAALDLPTVFRAPLHARRATGMVHWEKTATAWRITGDDLRVTGDDGTGSGAMTFELPHDRSVSPVLRLYVDFRDGNGAHAARYYPAYHLPPRTLEWMEWAFLGGRVLSGHLIYEGPIRAWPFEAGQGRFEIRGRVRDGVYRYLRGWTPLTQAEANVAIDGPNVRVTGQGRIGTLLARNVSVEVKRAEDGQGRLARVQAQVEGPVAETLRVLQTVDSSRATAWQTYARDIARAEGTGKLDLDVQIPIRQERGPSFLASYRFTNAALKLADGGGLEGANGFVSFSEAGLRESSVQGTLFGGPLVLAAAHNGGELHVHAAGKVLPAELLRGRRPLAERVSGDIDWSLAWQNRPSGPQVRAQADLRAVRSRLPAPLAKADATSLDALTISTEQSAPGTLVLALNGGSALNGKLAFAREDGDWRFQKGRIDVGKPTTRLPQANGLEVGLNIDALDVDRWLPLIGTGTSPAAATATPPFLTALTADIKRLDLANRRWGRLFVHLVQRGSEWRTVLDGDALAGEGALVFAPKTPPRIRLDLAYLRLPERAEAQAPAQDKDKDKEATDPRRLPTLDLHALSFEYKQRKFGELNFAAAPYEQGWRVERMNLTRPEMKLVTRGVWRIVGERQATDLNIEFDSDNMGATLDGFGSTGQMADGKVKLRANLSWPGSPMRPALAGLDGKIELTAEKGRFLKFDPGAARLFGLLDLRSIGRYLTLDFSPAFGKGFVFDAIHGTITLERGNAYTRDFVVRGPSLGMGANGRIGLAAEDYDLVLEASPKFDSTLTLTSWGLFGPGAAAAVLALQKLFKRQIEAGTRITYVVKGPWDNPKVTKLSKSSGNEAAPPTQ